LPLADKTKVARKQSPDEEEDSDNDDKQSSVIFERKKGETSEERRARKHAVKEIRKVNYFLSKFDLIFSILGSKNSQKSNENCFQTRRTETITRTSFTFNTSSFTKSSCHLKFVFFSSFLYKNEIQSLIVLSVF
jgi:hypothetical protein